MQRFMSSAASSSAGSAERPVRPCHLKISSIRDVQSWLAEEPIASSSSADVQRIREAAAVLSHPKPRQEDVRPLQSKWQVAQTKDKKPRPLGAVAPEAKAKSSKRHKSYSNNYQTMLTALLQLEPMCRMILLLIEAVLNGLLH